MNNSTFTHDTIVIGGGQAGLATGYYLRRQGRDFIILDAKERIGDAWRKRWDSLRLFTPARYSGLPGMPFPAPSHSILTKDQMADYMEAYAARFELPVQTDTRVDSLSKQGRQFIITAGGRHYKADNVVVAMSTFQKPRLPSFAQALDPGIVQLHSSDYRNPSQLKDGEVLIVGAGNSGAEIALELSRSHRVTLSGRHPGSEPTRPGSALDRLITPVIWFVFSHVLTVNTPIGRKVAAQLRYHGTPLGRVKPADLPAAGVERIHARTVGVQDGRPVLEDGRVLDVKNVIWCTGFQPGFDWIALPIFNDNGDPLHERGVVATEPGLYFVGLFFQSAANSSLVGGVGKDAEYVVRTITSNTLQNRPLNEFMSPERTPID